MLILKFGSINDSLRFIFCGKMDKTLFFEAGQKHETYSVTKSVTSALIGIAIDKDYIKDVNQTITQLFPNKKKSKIFTSLKD